MRSNKYSEDIKFDNSDVEVEYDPGIDEKTGDSDENYQRHAEDEDENIEREPQ